MLLKEIREIIIAKFCFHYKATVSSNSVKNLSEVIKSMQTLEFTKKDVVKYVDFCMNHFKTTTNEKQKLSSVNYFAAIVANKNSLKKYLDQSLKEGEVKVERSLRMQMIMRELRGLFEASPTESNLVRIRNVATRLDGLGYSNEEVSTYIDYCIKIFKKMVKNPRERSNVSNFTCFFTSEKMVNRYQDYRKTFNEMREENPIESEEEDDSTMTIAGHTYHRILQEDDREIFFCPIIVRFMIKDYAGMVPKIYRLNKYNECHPENLITMDTVKGLVKGGKLCHT